MPLAEDFYLELGRICLAHEFVLDRVHSCEYPCGRGVCGLVYILCGVAEYRFANGERLTVGAGDALLLWPSAAYAIRTEGELHHYTVNFPIRAEGGYPDPGGAPYLLLHAESTAALAAGMRELIAIRRAGGDGYVMQAAGLLYRLVALFLCEHARAAETGYHGRLAAARAAIAKHPERATPLSELAALSNMSVTNFRREWRRVYGDTPLQYRDALRIERAREYLFSRYYTVTEVAALCGFEDVSYFVRFFKRHTGSTPGELRGNREP